jgi:hypothetical protein
VLQYKCLSIAINAPWYVGSKKIHEDLGIPFFADHIRALTDSFDSKLADAGNPLFRPVEAAFKEAAKSTQRLMQHYPDNLTEFFSAFPEL